MSEPKSHQATYISCAIRWLVSHDKRTAFTTTEVYDVYRHLVPPTYLESYKSVRERLSHNSSWLRIRRIETRPTESYVENGYVIPAGSVVVWAVKDRIKHDSMLPSGETT